MAGWERLNSSQKKAGEMKFRCKEIVGGFAEGEALVSRKKVSFLGDIEPESGRVVAADSDIYSKSVAGKIFVFPTPRGSTVGTYILLRMKKLGTAPLAIINRKTEAIVAVGALIAGIPLVEAEDEFFKVVKTGDRVVVDTERGYIYRGEYDR